MGDSFYREDRCRKRANQTKPPHASAFASLPPKTEIVYPTQVLRMSS